MQQVFVITGRAPEVMRSGRTWHLRARSGFYLVPTARSEPVTEVDAARLLAAATSSRPRELVLGGWLVRAVGDPWGSTDLVQELRTAVLDGPAAVATSMRPAYQRPTTFTARLQAAWNILLGRTTP